MTQTTRWQEKCDGRKPHVSMEHLLIGWVYCVGASWATIPSLDSALVKRMPTIGPALDSKRIGFRKPGNQALCAL